MIRTTIRTIEFSHQDGGKETFNPAHVVSIRIKEGADTVDVTRERWPATIFVTTRKEEKVFRYHVIETARREYREAVVELGNYIQGVSR